MSRPGAMTPSARWTVEGAGERAVVLAGGARVGEVRHLRRAPSGDGLLALLPREGDERVRVVAVERSSPFTVQSTGISGTIRVERLDAPGDLDVSTWSVASARRGASGVLTCVVETPEGARTLVSRATSEEISQMATALSPFGRLIGAVILESVAQVQVPPDERRVARERSIRDSMNKMMYDALASKVGEEGDG